MRAISVVAEPLVRHTASDVVNDRGKVLVILIVQLQLHFTATVVDEDDNYDNWTNHPLYSIDF